MTHPLRLLMVSHFYESHGGGIERVAGHVARALGDAGHPVCWAASQTDAVAADPRIETLPLSCFNPTERLTGLPMPIPTPAAIAALARAVRQADAVIIHDALYVTSIIAMAVARRAGRPAVLIQHIAELEFTNPLMRGIMRLATKLVTRPMLRTADRVVFISERVRGTFAGIAMQCEPLMLFNGVDPITFHPTPPADETVQLRHELGLPAEGRLITFVGRFVPKKGMQVICECALRRPDLTFVLAGTGPIDPARWGLANVYPVGALQPGAVAALLRQSSLLLLPSTGEGYPLVVQEAMACGLPVICGEDSAAADISARRYLNAVRIQHDDIAGTVKRILPLLDRGRGHDPASEAAMAAYAGATYSWDAMARTIVGSLAAD